MSSRVRPYPDRYSCRYRVRLEWPQDSTNRSRPSPLDRIHGQYADEVDGTLVSGRPCQAGGRRGCHGEISAPLRGAVADHAAGVIARPRIPRLPDPTGRGQRPSGERRAAPAGRLTNVHWDPPGSHESHMILTGPSGVRGLARFLPEPPQMFTGSAPGGHRAAGTGRVYRRYAALVRSVSMTPRRPSLNPRAVIEGRPPGRPGPGLIIGIAAGLGCALIVLGIDLLSSVEGAGHSAVPFLVALPLALLPVPLLIAVVLLLDRLEPEPRANLALCFAWGAGVAALLAAIINTAGLLFITQPELGKSNGEFISAAFGAPLVEETLKGAVLFWLLWRRRP